MRRNLLQAGAASQGSRAAVARRRVRGNLAGADLDERPPLLLAQGPSSWKGRAPPAGGLHWFVDGSLVASAPPLKDVRWTLERGSHQVRCVDDRGRGAVVRIRVR